MQPTSGYATYVLAGSGTIVIGTAPINFHSLTTFGTLAGTTVFYNTSTAAGTAAGNQIFAMNQVTGVGTQINTSLFDFSCPKGLVAVATGTVYQVIAFT